MHVRLIIILTIIWSCAMPVKAAKKGRKAKIKGKAAEAAKTTNTAAPASPKQEIVRDWKDAAGNVLVRGKFWHVGRGILKIRTETSPEPVSLKLSSVSPEDIQYVLRDHGQVIGPTCRLLRSGYAVSANGHLVSVPASQKRIMGSVSEILDDTMALIKIGTKSYMVMCDTSKLRRGKKFEGYLKRQSESKIDLPNGQQGYLYRAYLAVESEKHLAGELQRNPRPYLNQITGYSAAYSVWLETQRQLEKIKAHEEKKDEIASERSKQKMMKEQEKAERAKNENREKLAIKYQKEIERYSTRLKEAEADIKRLEYRKKTVKAYSNTWSSVRNRIRQLEAEVLRIKKTIRELEKQLRDVE